jgi:Ogr/Delta-like zinc finger
VKIRIHGTKMIQYLCLSLVRPRIHPGFRPCKKLYCSCRNPECGHTCVMDLSFSHTLSPSALDLPPKLRDQVRAAGCRQEQRQLFEAVG